MRKTILLTLFAVLAIVAKAQNTLNVFQKDNSVVYYTFATKPEPVITPTEVTIKTPKMEITIPLNTILMYTFADVKTNGFVTNRVVNEKNTPVKVLNAAGEVVKTVTASRLPKAKASDPQKERASFTFTDLPAGTYTVQNGSTTYTVVKK